MSYIVFPVTGMLQQRISLHNLKTNAIRNSFQ